MSNFFKNPFESLFPKHMVGIDIGTSSVKIVEISKMGEGKTLENYGEIQSSDLYKDSLSDIQKGNSSLSGEFVAKAIRAILNEAHIKTRAAVLSIPDFSTFCTSFTIPKMTQKEIPEAIRYNASQYITLPISEVTLDWKVLPSEPGDEQSHIKVFLVAVPNQVVTEYQNVAKLAGLKLHALEAETLGITRSLIQDNKKAVCIMDIGVQSSTINVVDKGFLKKSYSFNFNSNQFARVLASTLGIDYPQAEAIKNKQGLLYPRQDIAKALYVLVDPLLVEIRNVAAEFLQSDKKAISEIYLTGGTANLPGLKEYMAESLKKNVFVPNCFSEFLYPPVLDQTLHELSPSFSAAIGAALGGLES